MHEPLTRRSSDPRILTSPESVAKGDLASRAKKSGSRTGLPLAMIEMRLTAESAVEFHQAADVCHAVGIAVHFHSDARRPELSLGKLPIFLTRGESASV
jgi:hypothetical protein